MALQQLQNLSLIHIFRRDDAGADGGKAVEALAEIPLLVRGLDVPGRDIVQDGVAADVVSGLPCGNVLGIPAQHLSLIHIFYVETQK